MSLNIPYKQSSGFNVETNSGVLNIASGLTGDLVTISPPAGKSVRLDYLSESASGTQVGISIIVGGSTVIDQKTLKGTSLTPSSGQFSVGGDIQTVEPIIGDIDEDIVINKNAGNTTQQIRYAYSIGE